MTIRPVGRLSRRLAATAVAGLALLVLFPRSAGARLPEGAATPVMPPADFVLQDVAKPRSPAVVSIDESGRSGTLVLPRGPDNEVLQVAFTPDGARLLTGRFRGELDTWDTKTWTKVRGVDTGHYRVTAMAISSDGQYVATGGDDKLVKIWSVASGDLVTKIRRCKDWPEQVAFSPDGKLLAVVDNGGSDFVYDRESRSVTKSPVANNIAFSRTGATFVTVLAEELAIWDTRTWQVKARIPNDGGSMRVVVLDEERNRAATGSFQKDGTRIWDLNTHALAMHLPSGFTASLAFTPDGRWLFTGGDGRIRLWSLDSGGEQACVSPELGLWSLTVSHDGRWLAAGVDSTAQVWEVDKLIKTCYARSSSSD